MVLSKAMAADRGVVQGREAGGWQRLAGLSAEGCRRTPTNMFYLEGVTFSRIGASDKAVLNAGEFAMIAKAFFADLTKTS
jgi:hypothetical protein